MNKFNSGDYIVTRDGQRGFVVYEIPKSKGFYKVHLTEGYQVYSERNLEIDLLMYQEMTEVCDISK